MASYQNLMLVDDDEDDQTIFTLALEEIDGNIDCHIVNNGPKALQALKEDTNFTPDLIFLDLNMPRMHGKECLTEIKKLPAYKTTPVIIYSTSYNQKDKTETMELGAYAFITKPSTIGELSQILTSFFNSL